MALPLPGEDFIRRLAGAGLIDHPETIRHLSIEAEPGRIVTIYIMREGDDHWAEIFATSGMGAST